MARQKGKSQKQQDGKAQGDGLPALAVVPAPSFHVVVSAAVHAHVSAALAARGAEGAESALRPARPPGVDRKRSDHSGPLAPEHALYRFLISSPSAPPPCPLPAS